MADIARQLDPRRIEVVDEAVAEVLRRKTPAQRMAMVSQGWSTAKLIVTGGIRSQHPDWNDSRVDAELRRRMGGGTA